MLAHTVDAKARYERKYRKANEYFCSPVSYITSLCKRASEQMETNAKLGGKQFLLKIQSNTVNHEKVLFVRTKTP